MKYYSFSNIVAFTSAAVVASFMLIISPLSTAEPWPASHITRSLAPYFEPYSEIAFQAVIREGDAFAVPANDPTLNKRLRDVDIRTALEDQRRYHYDLG